jgi:hypothetical protein
MKDGELVVVIHGRSIPWSKMTGSAGHLGLVAGIPHGA